MRAQQLKIAGTVRSGSNKKGIQGASILLRSQEGLTRTFAISNPLGKFSMAVPDSNHSESMFLEINCLGYKKIKQIYKYHSASYDFFLEDTAIELHGVTVKSTPAIIQKEDTLSYNVNSFARKEDRSIGDVIGHMPGMAIGEDGQISYNGTNISNLYIHGDDLMDGRYGLATKTISKEMIQSVDVLLNYQPKKVLKGKVPSNDIAINLVLRNENSLKLSGQAIVGFGLPGQYDGAINSMVFNKRFKMLNSIKANNSGIDYRNDFNQYNGDNNLSTNDNTRPRALLSASTAGNPDLPKQNYYFNNSGIINANNLVNTKDSLQLRTNIQLFLDRNTLDYKGNTSIYLPADTFRYNQVQHAVRKPLVLNASFLAQTNKTRYFFSDRLAVNYASDKDFSTLNFNGHSFDQLLKGATYDISNDFVLMPLQKNSNLLSFRWYVNLYRLPQHLNVYTGIDSAILNNNKPYSAVNQNSETPTFFSNFTVGYIIGKTRLISQSYEAGMINEVQQLNTELYLTQTDGTINQYAGDPGNSLKWYRNRVFVNASYSLKRENWQAGLSFPLSVQSIRYSQAEYALDQKKNQFLFNPAASVRFFLNTDDFISGSYSYKNNIGNITGVYRGLVLVNYRSLVSNDADLQEKYSSAFTVNYQYKRPVKMLFINAGIHYTRITSNAILSSILTNQIQRTVLLSVDNNQSTIRAYADISKYLFLLRTKLSLHPSFIRSFYDQFINGNRLPYINDNFSLGWGLDTKLPGNIVFNYTGTGMWTYSRPDQPGAKTIQNRIKRFDQGVNIGYVPNGLFVLNLAGRDVYTQQAGQMPISYFFLDANVRYRLVKHRIDLELALSNLTNIQQYNVLTLSSNQISTSDYTIRGRMAIMRVTFNL